MTISKTRGYIEGGALPISVLGINAYLSAFGTHLNRDFFDSAMYALDQIILEHWKKKE